MAESKLSILERESGDVTILVLTGQILIDDGDLAIRCFCCSRRSTTKPWRSRATAFSPVEPARRDPPYRYPRKSRRYALSV